MHPEELNLASSPALRRLFGRVIDAVGSAVSGMQDTEREVRWECCDYRLPAYPGSCIFFIWVATMRWHSIPILPPSENADLNLICFNLWRMAATTVGSVQQKEDFGSKSVNHCLMHSHGLHTQTESASLDKDMNKMVPALTELGLRHVPRQEIHKPQRHDMYQKLPLKSAWSTAPKSTFNWGADPMPIFETRITWPTWPSEIWSYYYSANSLIRENQIVLRCRIFCSVISRYLHYSTLVHFMAGQLQREGRTLSSVRKGQLHCYTSIGGLELLELGPLSRTLQSPFQSQFLILFSWQLWTDTMWLGTSENMT